MFTNKDVVHLKNLQRILAKANITLQGEEILAAADVLRWVSILEAKMLEDIQKQEAILKVAQGIEKIQGPEKVTTQVTVSKPKKQIKKSETE